MADIIQFKENPDTPQQTAGDAHLRRLLAQMIRSCPLKRAEICARLSSLLGIRVSPFMLDCYTSESKKKARFPAAFIEPFCEVVGNDALQRRVMGARLRGIVDLREEQLAWLTKSLRAGFVRANGQRRAGKLKSKPTRKA
ncbi:MAG: hypothetical protein WCD04_14460 [Terriglobia bacterium]|jgi:hypothetical protein